MSRNWSEDKLHKWKTPTAAWSRGQNSSHWAAATETPRENVDWNQSTWTFVTVDFSSAVTALKCPDLHRATLANALGNPAQLMEVPSFSSLRNQFLVVQFYLHCESWALQALEENLKKPAQSWKALFNPYSHIQLLQGHPALLKHIFHLFQQSRPSPDTKLETRHSLS